MYQKVSYVGLMWIVAALLAVTILGNVICFRAAVRRMEEMQTDYESRVSEQVEVNVTTQLEDKAAEIVERIVKNEQETVAASTSEDTLQVDTVYQIQSYDVNTDNTVTDYETLPQELVGLNREETDVYCSQYMDKLPVEEFLNGLQSIGVVSFSKERLVVKKIYDSTKVEFRYYLIAVDDEVVVYYGDKKTVYEYTGIETRGLPEEEKQALKQGIEVQDEEELYGILENYSS